MKSRECTKETYVSCGSPDGCARWQVLIETGSKRARAIGHEGIWLCAIKKMQPGRDSQLLNKKEVI